LVPPQEPVHVQVKVVALVVTDEAVPELHKFVVGAVHEESVSAEPQEAFTVGKFVALQEASVESLQVPTHFQFHLPSLPTESVQDSFPELHKPVVGRLQKLSPLEPHIFH